MSLDPIDQLRRANPVPPTEPTEPGIADALFESIVVEDRRPQPPQITRVLLAAAAVVVVIALAAGARAIAVDSERPADVAQPIPTSRPAVQETTTSTAPNPSVSPPTGIASCVELYSLEAVVRREVAFTGAVRSTDAGTVTFDVDQWFRGGRGPEVTLDGNGLIGPGLSSNDSGVRLVQGERYLVSGDGGFVWGCGFTQPYDSAVAAAWMAAFAGADD